MSTTNVTTATLPLHDGGTIPVVGLGVWQAARGATTREAVATALRLGYRHVDTARIYGNEEDVGEGIRASGIARGEVFVTTKLWNDDHGYDAALRAFDASLKRLRLEYVDLYLIHWPVSGKRADSWRALEKLKADGLARHIGVSNYLVPHMKELFGTAKELPTVNQIELHPFLQHRETRALCDEHRIVVEAYSPLTRGRRLGDPTLVAIAKEVSRTPAQVILRWAVQHRLVVLPKSTHEARIAENAGIFDFELPDSAMRRLDSLDEGHATGWDPRDQK
ncbi:MAG: aldo/keto reductase [Labilithrix sp.]|nr:aldo/keto reductase [Labilithrix sp.]MCW5810212.1 aldo/keto reductase [Labilithrix sp.]